MAMDGQSIEKMVEMKNGQHMGSCQDQPQSGTAQDSSQTCKSNGLNLSQWDSEMNSSLHSESDLDIQKLLSDTGTQCDSGAHVMRSSSQDPVSNRSSLSIDEEDVPMASPLSPLEKMEPRVKKRKSGRCFVAIGNQNGHHSKPGTPDELHPAKDSNDNSGSKKPPDSERDEVDGDFMDLDNAQYSINGNNQATEVPHYKTVDELDSKFPYRSVMNISLSLQASSETETV